MSHRTETIALPTMSPGTQRSLRVHRFGSAGGRPKAYLQAALYADELPGMLVAHHLLSLLRKADDRREIKGEVVLVPVANPIGVGGGDFEHDWPDLSAGLRKAVEPMLNGDSVANVRTIRAALADRIAMMRNKDEHSALRQILMGFAYDSDIVIDLQCDDEVLPHVHMLREHWRAGSDLAAELGAAACLLSDDPDVDRFDETFARPWNSLREEFGRRFPIPAACLTATVALRGRHDVSDRLALGDAEALYRFLQRRKLIAGKPGALPPPARAIKVELLDVIRAPIAGLVSCKVAPGDSLADGDLVAEIIDPLAADPASARTPVRARTDGTVLARYLTKLASPSDAIATIIPFEPSAPD